MDITNHRRRVIDYLELIERAARSFLESIPSDQREALLSLNDGPSLAVIADGSVKNTTRAHHTEAVLLLQECKAAHQILTALSFLDNGGAMIEDINPWVLADAMITVGHCYGLMNMCDFGRSQDFHDTIHAKMVDHKRYGMDREDYASAIQEGREYWEASGTDLHHVVTKRLAKKYNINFNGLKKRLAPIAREYGRCFGDPGTTKGL